MRLHFLVFTVYFARLIFRKSKYRMSAKRLSLEKFAERLTHLLPRLGREVSRYDRNLFTQGDITLPQLWTLEHLLECSVCTMCELAERLHLQGSTTTGLVDRLARRGLVQRRRSQTDRRVVHVALTTKGRQCMEAIRHQKEATLIRWFGRLTRAECMNFLATIEKLVQELAGATDHEGPS